MTEKQETMLADEIHQMLCRENHIDRCSWFYESWDRPFQAREEYLNRARRLIRLAAHFDVQPEALLRECKHIFYEKT